MDGKNILDFVDPDIEARLAELEAEEDQRAQLAELEGDDDDDMDDEVNAAQAKVSMLAKSIRKKKGLIKEKGRMNKKNNHPTMSRAVAARASTVGEFVKHMADMGVRTDAASLPNLKAAARSKFGGADSLPARERRRDQSVDAGERRGRSLTRDGRDDDDDAMDTDGVRKLTQRANQVRKDRSSTARDQASLARSRSRDPSASGLRDEAHQIKVTKLQKKQQKMLNKQGRASESDRRIPTLKPKHLFSGKRGNGKTDRR